MISLFVSGFLCLRTQLMANRETGVSNVEVHLTHQNETIRGGDFASGLHPSLNQELLRIIFKLWGLYANIYYL